MDIITILMLCLVSQHIIQCPALYMYYIYTHEFYGFVNVDIVYWSYHTFYTSPTCWIKTQNHCIKHHSAETKQF